MNTEPYILIIEDNQYQARHLQTLLTRLGNRVRIVHDSHIGLQQAYTCPPIMLLLAIDLPGMDGFQVLSVLKRNPSTASIPVIMLVRRAHPADTRRAVSLGANGYLMKEDYLIEHYSHNSQLLRFTRLLITARPAPSAST